MTRASRFAAAVVSIPLIVMAVYWLLDGPFSVQLAISDRGVIMLIAIGLAIGFVAFVLIRGARER